MNTCDDPNVDPADRPAYDGETLRLRENPPSPENVVADADSDRRERQVVLCADGTRHYTLGQEVNFRDLATAVEWADEFSAANPACGGVPHVVYDHCVCDPS